MNIELDDSVNDEMIIRVESKTKINEKKFVKELIKKHIIQKDEVELLEDFCTWYNEEDRLYKAEVIKKVKDEEVNT